MRDMFFIDTNIFVYSFDTTNSKKQKIAIDIIDKARSTCSGTISTQVVQEFLNVATRKFKTPINAQDSKVYLAKVLEPLCKVYSDFPLFELAIYLQATTKYSFYDSLIIAAALKGNCRILYTEDLQNDQRIYDLTIKNPF